MAERTKDDNSGEPVAGDLQRLASDAGHAYDATRIQVRALAGSAELPARLLALGMPLTLVAGTVVAALLFTELSIWEAAILATILAPTDAGLGHAVMSSPRVPQRLRQALNVEAGLNDGLSMPFLMLFIALARVDAPLQDTFWFEYALGQGVKGVVLEALGGGRTPPWWLPVIRRAVESGVAVVVASRCPSGRVWDGYGYAGAYKDLRALGALQADGLNGQKARIRLMCVLGAASSPAEAAELWTHGAATTLP